MKFFENISKKLVSVVVSENPDIPYFESRGFTLQEVEEAYDGSWYLEGYAPVKPVEEMQAEVRAVRNQYLETYVDPKQLVMVWDSLSADDKKLYADYRQYLLDYTEQEDWYLQNPMTFEEWALLEKDL